MENIVMEKNSNGNNHPTWGSDRTLIIGMDQLTDYLNIKHLIEETNISSYLASPFNFSDYDSILDEYKNGLYTIHDYTTVILLSLYVPTFIVGLVGNVLIIISSIRENSKKKSKNYFLANLAIADLLVTLFCMPATVGTIVYRPWVYGRFLCKFIAFLQGVAVAISIFSLTAMSIDRYIYIQHPVASRKIMTAGQAMVMVTAMWIVSIIFMAPLLYIRNLYTVDLSPLPQLSFCVEQWPQDRDRHAYGLFLLFVVFLIPAGTLIVCYSQVGRALCTNDIHRENSDSSTRSLFSRKKAARMLIILVLIFMICWLPYNIASITTDLAKQNILIILFFTLWLGQAHSAINPIMYWVLNRQFRQRVRGMVKWVQTYSCTTTSTHTLPEYV